jgi:formylglycine-generating enzyme required for sulfatase activity
MKIFISYRRAEDNKTYIIGTIHEKIAKVFGSENVFRDTYNIGGGADWRNVLEREVNSCKVMVVIAGPDWANLAYPNGEKRLFDPNDVTRWEVETGLKRRKEVGITVIPVRVMGAEIPKKEELPESLHQLFDIQWNQLRNFPDFDVDIEKLISDIRQSQGFREDDISTKHFEPKTIYIAEGAFLMGSPLGEGIPGFETPQHEIFLPAYRIGKYPVTNAQYEEFISRTKKEVPSQMGWDGQKVPQGFEDCPVTGVTWIEALAYCQWLSENTEHQYSLPNEAQWEKACRGGKNTIFPWGDEFDPVRCNHGYPEVAPVNKYPAQNEFGLFDLVGNVLQWTCTLWGKKLFPPDIQYPWIDDMRNNIRANPEIRRVLRGSSMNYDVKSHRCSARSGQVTDDRGLSGARHGFRVMMNV